MTDELVIDETPVELVEAPDKPIEYYKSQAEKFSRLLTKTEKSMNDALAKKDEELGVVTGRLAQIETTLNAEKEARFSEYKLRLLSEQGLDPDLVEFVTATDEEAVKAQVTKLADKFKQTKVVNPRVGNSTGKPQTGKPDFLNKGSGSVGGGFIVNN